VWAAVEDDAAPGAHEVGEAGRLAALVAKAALERRPEPLLTAQVLEDPRLREERRPVPHVPLVAAVELGDPLAFSVLVEADDRPLHSSSSTRRRLERSCRRERPGKEGEMTRSIEWDKVAHDDVVRAIGEYDRLGPEQFFAAHGFAPTTTYDLLWERRRYPPKAVLGTAYELATGERLASGDFEGGKSGAVKVLTNLGFTVQERKA
jgi:hypothetical protein